MKKLLLVLTAVLSLNLVGCSSDTGSEVKNVPTSEIQVAVNTEELLPVQPVAEQDAKDFYVFENVKDSIEEGFIIQAMMNVKLQDVFVVKTTDVEGVKSAIEEYKTNNLQMFADGYGGEENAEAVSNSILEAKGDYVYFIATNNAKDIEAKILSLLE